MVCVCYDCRGSAADWYEALSNYLRVSKIARSWFADNVLFAHPERFSEYLLEATSSDVSCLLLCSSSLTETGDIV